MNSGIDFEYVNVFVDQYLKAEKLVSCMTTYWVRERR